MGAQAEAKLPGQLDRQLNTQLDSLRQQALFRQRRITDSPAGPVGVFDGRQLLSFCSNDYLGHANHPKVRDAFIEAAKQWGVGSGAAHLVTGHTRVHHELELALAEFTGRERALLFSTGYMANLAVLATLGGRDTHLLLDKLDHASLLDGGQLSPARLHRYQHADPASLQRQLLRFAGQPILIASDGVFSMDGDIAPLPALVASAQQAGAMLMIDDAHGIGVLGANGRGSLEQFALDSQQVPVLVGTLGKALGTAGAFVAGDEAFIETLLQKARSYIYTTAQPAAVAAATLASLELVSSESWRRERLAALVSRFKQQAAALGLPMLDSPTAIQPLLAGSAERALAWAAQLEQQGILVTPIRPPTVPAGSARLRITLSASHTDAQLDQLLEALAALDL